MTFLGGDESSQNGEPLDSFLLGFTGFKGSKQLGLWLLELLFVASRK